MSLPADFEDVIPRVCAFPAAQEYKVSSPRQTDRKGSEPILLGAVGNLSKSIPESVWW